MLETIKEVLIDFVIVGIPFFILGHISTLIFMVNEKYKADDKKENTRNKRIKYIDYLTSVVIRKRREESKIDVD